MTTSAPTPTDAPTSYRRLVVAALGALAVACVLAVGPGQVAGAQQIDPGCVDPRGCPDDPDTDTPGLDSDTDEPTTDEPTTDETTPTTAESTPVPTAGTDGGDDGVEETSATSDAGDDDGDDGGTSILALAGVGLVAFVLGAVVAAVPLGAALSRRRGGSAGPATPTPPPAPPVAAGGAPGGIAIGPAPSRDTDQVRQQRNDLAQALIALRDQVPSEALGGQASAALAAAGIVELSPIGQPFDPGAHRAVDQVATDDPARHDTVVAVERPGYADGAVVLRQPDVVVARYGGGS